MRTLDDLSRTALIPFWARVSDASEPGSILNDKAAAQIAPLIEQRFGSMEVGESTRMGCCLRNLFVDKWLTQLTAGCPSTVVDIGVGLDTRLRRLPLTIERYVEVDCGQVIELRDELLPDTAAVRIAGDGMNVAEWVGALNLDRQRTIILLEGILTYQAPARVRRFFAELAEAVPGGLLLFDSMSPLSAWLANRPSARGQGQPTYRWSPWSTRHICVGNGSLKVIAEQGLLDLSPRFADALSQLEQIVYRLPLMRRSYRLTLAQLPVRQGRP